MRGMQVGRLANIVSSDDSVLAYRYGEGKRHRRKVCVRPGTSDNIVDPVARWVREGVFKFGFELRK